METTKNPLPLEANIFLNKLSEYLNVPFYFFGSIQRNDYFPKYSDIDIDVFTENMEQTLSQLKTFIIIPDKTKVKKIIWKLKNGVMAYGYKYMYREPNFCAEFSFYDKIFKQDILQEHGQKINLPFYVEGLLIFIKILYYYLKVLNKKTFKQFKQFLLSSWIGLPEDLFFVLPLKIS
jgi:hypothetical protein